MLKNKNFIMFAALGLGFLTCMIILCITSAKEANSVSDSVLRFHIVANSDRQEDQQLKLKVRDGIAKLTDELFADSQTKEQAIEIARQNTDVIAAAAEQILRDNGCNDSVEVAIQNLYFPTKTYENISFPAGNYDAIHITLGSGEGQNFWCVMFPALCVPSVSEDNEELLSGVLDESEMKLVTHPYTLKFKTAELWGKIKNIFTN